MYQTKKLIFTSLITSILLGGCGGGGGGESSSSNTNSSTSQTGTLIDNIVSGVKYINGTNSGFTNSDGQFSYTSGNIEFYLGSIKIGELNSLPNDKNVFIQDLVNVERTNITDEKVLKIASLLQSLDSDSTTDKIEITKTDFDKFNGENKNIDNINIDSVLLAQGFIKKSDENIKQHLENGLKTFKILTDNIAPKVSCSIDNNEKDIPINSNITLIFSENISKAYINKNNISIKDSTGNNVEFDISHENSLVNLKPKNNLNYNTVYTLTVKSDIKDFAGNNLLNDGSNGDFIINFTTQDEIDKTAPIFKSPSSVSVDENQISVLTVEATDNSKIIYSLDEDSRSIFNIDSSLGIITFKIAPDYEIKNNYTLNVLATDESNNVSSQNLTINIKDILELVPDETPPTFTSMNTFNINENQKSIGTITTTDDSPVSYYISGIDSSYFEIIASTGVLSFKNTPDYETKNSYSITIKAIDSANNYSTQDVIININDIIDETTILFKGLEYKIITSPITGRKWLDRNLGATQVCTSSTDSSCYGDYYQWGRLADGHEKITSSTTLDKAIDINNTDDKFITGLFDWANKNSETRATRSIRWQRTDGTGICPVGFKVPDYTELKNETTDYENLENISNGTIKVTNLNTAYQNFLKIPSNGYRDGFWGGIGGFGSWGTLWTSSYYGGLGINVTISLSIETDKAYMNQDDALYGFGVRCIGE